MPMGKSIVRMATTDAEKDAIYRLRYDVYVEEMGGGDRHTEADRGARLLRDEWDEHAHHFFAMQDGEMAACARVNLRKDGSVECEDLLEMARFAPFYPNAVSTTSRFAVHPRLRGSHLMRLLACAVYRFHREQGIRLLFIDCHTRLLPLYSRLGFRIYKPGFKHPKYVYVIPMVLVLDDLEYLEQVASPFVPIARRFPRSIEGRELLTSLFPTASQTFIATDQSPAAFWNLLRTRLLEPAATFQRCEMLDGLTGEETQMLLSIGHVVPARAGDPILGTGEAGREVFLILEGSFQVLRRRQGGEPQVLKILARGDVFGEIGFLTEGIRSASIQAMEDSTLLVLNARALDRLVTTAESLAAKFFRNLARIVATRLRDAIGF
jgi:predicted GNAT family N-acyltransferase